MRNLSYQRLQLKGPNRFGASLHSRGHIWEHLQRCEARGSNLEVAVVIGTHPAINLAAGAKVAMEVDEFDDRRRVARPAGRTGQMQDHRRRSAGGGRIRASKAKSLPTSTRTKALRRIHRLFDRPLDPQRVRRQGDHSTPQADLPRHHSRLFGRTPAARPLRQGGARLHAPQGNGAQSDGAELPEVGHALPCLYVDQEDRGGTGAPRADAAARARSAISNSWWRWTRTSTSSTRRKCCGRSRRASRPTPTCSWCPRCSAIGSIRLRGTACRQSSRSTRPRRSSGM